MWLVVTKAGQEATVAVAADAVVVGGGVVVVEAAVVAVAGKGNWRHLREWAEGFLGLSEEETGPPGAMTTDWRH